MASKVIGRRSDDFTKIEDELVALFERLLSELPPNTASLEMRRVGRNAEGLLITLKPQSPDAASAWAHTENGLHVVDFGFGNWESTWELPTEGDNPKADKWELFQEVEDLCKAVMNGRCEHKRGLLSITGSIHARNRTYRVTDMFVLRAKPPIRGTYTYGPYVPRI